MRFSPFIASAPAESRHRLFVSGALGFGLACVLALPVVAHAQSGEGAQAVAAAPSGLAQPPETNPSALSALVQSISPDLGGLNQQFTHLTTGVSSVRDSLSQTTSGLVLNAMEFLGVPYRRGGSSAATGFDCSGFVRSVYENTLGTVLPRRASEQAQSTQAIEKDELRPGDLVFFNTMRRAFSHVGIYVGDGKFIHSPRAGGKVRVEDMRESYWTSRFNGARRVPAAVSVGDPSFSAPK